MLPALPPPCKPLDVNNLDHSAFLPWSLIYLGKVNTAGRNHIGMKSRSTKGTQTLQSKREHDIERDMKVS